MDKVDTESDDIINSFKRTVISDDLGKITENASEIVIDSILNDGLLKDVPLIGTTIGLYRLGKTISARKQIKKLWKFLFQLNEVPQADRIKFLKKVEKDEKSKNELFERILFIIERLDDEKKADIVGRLFKNLVKEKIETNDFLRLSTIIDKTYMTDIKYFDIRHNRNCKISETEQHKFSRENDTDFIKESLITVGLLKKDMVENTVRQKVMGYKEKSYMPRFEPTDIGEILIKYGF